jgi:hypothetical protein
MNLIFRPGKPEDARACGAICYAAFKAIADAHHFPPDFPDIETPAGLMNYAFSAPGIYSVVAESDGQIVGSNLLWENEFIGGVGPITVEPVPGTLHKAGIRCTGTYFCHSGRCTWHSFSWL